MPTGSQSDKASTDVQARPLCGAKWEEQTVTSLLDDPALPCHAAILYQRHFIIPLALAGSIKALCSSTEKKQKQTCLRTCNL